MLMDGGIFGMFFLFKNPLLVKLFEKTLLAKVGGSSEQCQSNLKLKILRFIFTK